MLCPRAIPSLMNSGSAATFHVKQSSAHVSKAYPQANAPTNLGPVPRSSGRSSTHDQPRPFHVKNTLGEVHLPRIQQRNGLNGYAHTDGRVYLSSPQIDSGTTHLSGEQLTPNGCRTDR